MDNHGEYSLEALNPSAINESLKSLKEGVASKAILRGTRFRFKPKLRVFRLDPNQTHIEVLRTGRHQRKETIFLKDIHRIITDESLVTNGNLKKFLTSRVGEMYRKTSFVLEYGSMHDTIDIVCKNKEHYDKWISCLSYLIRDANVIYEADPIKM
jgi:hypothetical protein